MVNLIIYLFKLKLNFLYHKEGYRLNGHHHGYGNKRESGLLFLVKRYTYTLDLQCLKN